MSVAARRDPPRVEPPIVMGRVPPHDLDVEGAVLGAILLDRGALDRVLEILLPEHFYSESNERIYRVAQDLALANQPVDIVTVAAALRDRRLLAGVGGASYLAQLADATPNLSNVEAHAVIVRTKARMRRMIATCQVIAAEGYGDVGDVGEWLEDAESKVFELVQTSAQATMQQIGEGIRETFNSLVVAFESGQHALGIATGFDRIDAKTGGLRRKAVTIVAGRPGMGKSALAQNIAVNFAKAGHGAVVFALESGRDAFNLRVLCSQASVPLADLRDGTLQDHHWAALTEAATRMHGAPLFVDDAFGLTPVMLRAKVRRLAAELQQVGKRLELVVVDYLQLVDGKAGLPRDHTRDREIGVISRAMKMLSKECDVHVMALSQLNREVEKRRDRRPMLSDLRESGNVEQDADLALLLYRDEYYNPDDTKMPGLAEVNVAKQRDGSTGRLMLRFEGQYVRFGNLRAEDYPQPEAD